MARTGLADGMGGEEVITGSNANLGAQNPYFAGSMTTTGTIKTAASVVAAGSAVITGLVIADSKILSTTATGSPTTYGKTIQYGATILGAGSDVWVKFGTAFTDAPTALCYNAIGGGTAGNNNLLAGSITAGSFYIKGLTASEGFYWVALG